MSEVTTQPYLIPRGALIGAACLMAATVGSAILAHNTDIGAARLTLGNVAQARDLLFSDTENGSVRVTDAATGRVVDVLTPGSSGFVRVVLRGLAHYREVAGIGADLPFRLSRYTDGRTLLEDHSTGQSVTLRAFGNDNAQAFAVLFDKGK
jgi:putative photosynthetic complex assembly protein